MKISLGQAAQARLAKTLARSLRLDVAKRNKGEVVELMITIQGKNVEVEIVPQQIRTLTIDDVLNRISLNSRKVRVCRAIRNNGITTVAALCELTAEKIEKWRNFGVTFTNALCDALIDAGLDNCTLVKSVLKAKAQKVQAGNLGPPKAKIINLGESDWSKMQKPFNRTDERTRELTSRLLGLMLKLKKSSNKYCTDRVDARSLTHFANLKWQRANLPYRMIFTTSENQAKSETGVIQIGVLSNKRKKRPIK